MLNLRLLFVAVVWGVNFSIVKFALADFYPLSFTVLRFALAAIFLLGVMLLSREPFGIEAGDRLAVIKLGLIGITLYNIFFMEGLRYTSASHSALFIAMSPLFAALIQTVSGRERLTRRVTGGLLLAAAGALLITSGRHGSAGPAPKGLLGDALTICASVFWALFTIKAKPLLEKYSPVKVTAYSMAAGSVLLLPVGMYEIARQSWSAVTAPSWAALAFAAFIAGGVAYSFWYQGVRRIGVTGTIVYHYLVPFTAVVFAALFLGERITAAQIAGGAAVLAGVGIAQKNRNV
jgi:drug/metabolite transporter (DMT)-like permease